MTYDKHPFFLVLSVKTYGLPVEGVPKADGRRNNDCKKTIKAAEERHTYNEDNDDEDGHANSPGDIVTPEAQ